MEWTAAEIKRHRRLRGWSQDQAAAALGVSKRALINWENGHASPHATGRDALNRGFGTIPADDVVLLNQATPTQLITELWHRLGDRAGRIDEVAAYMQLLADLARLLADAAEPAADEQPQPNLPERDLDWPRRTGSDTAPDTGHSDSGA